MRRAGVVVLPLEHADPRLRDALMKAVEDHVLLALGPQLLLHVDAVDEDHTDKIGPAPSSPYLGLDHIGLEVTGIDKMAAELKAKGAVFTTEPFTIRPGVRIAFVRGPEGVSIELLERAKA